MSEGFERTERWRRGRQFVLTILALMVLGGVARLFAEYSVGGLTTQYLMGTLILAPFAFAAGMTIPRTFWAYGSASVSLWPVLATVSALVERSRTQSKYVFDLPGSNRFSTTFAESWGEYILSLAIMALPFAVFLTVASALGAGIVTLWPGVRNSLLQRHPQR